MKAFVFPDRQLQAPPCRWLMVAAVFLFWIGTTTAQDPTPAAVNVPWENQFNFLPQDPQGWSILTPSADSRLIYVSATDGNDATGVVYAPADPQIGSAPQSPAGPLQAFATITQAMAQARPGYPDWVLLKRGDTWVRNDRINVVSGRSAFERSVITYYGSHADQPLIRTSHGGLWFWRSVRYSAVVGLKFYAYERDPASPDFVGFDQVVNRSGFESYTDDAEAPNGTILIEDCVFDFFSGNIAQGPVETKDFIVRRCQVLNSYGTYSHSSGMYTNNASVLLEENFFDHNGWYQRQIGSGSEQAEGQGTMFNHNTYFSKTHNTIFRRNLFLRASSIGTKFTSNSPDSADEINAWNILLDNNLFVRGEIGISIGGNDDRETGVRWQEIHIMHNVFIDIGTDRPSNRALGWGIWLNDWQRGRIGGNYFVHYGSDEVTYIFGLQYDEHGEDLDIFDNLFYGLDQNDTALELLGSEPKQNIRVFGNRIQLAGTQMWVIHTDYMAPGTFFNNAYFSDRPADQWFMVNNTYRTLAEWQALTGDTYSTTGPLSFPDPERTITTYQTSLGKTATLDAFIQEAKQQNKFNWRNEYTAAEVNAYIRSGFLLPGSGMPKPPENLRTIK